ncbi:hypothetical protein ABT304_16245 [Nocardioides sp. NPDC000445]|uniref:hypothetical protein n=1 Tax=Nocardioides sp. NPDC000445 TaxID=3154257 RepID=UPI00332E3563
MAAEPEDRMYGGNHGYADDVSKYYSWNSRVPNHSNIASGDRVVVWDKRTLVGHSVIEKIDRKDGTAERRLCSNCLRPNITYRKTKTPDWRCQKCLTDFDKPVVDLAEVVHYTAHFERNWVDLHGVLSGPEIRKVALSSVSQHAMREMSWTTYVAALASKKRGVDGGSL